MCKIKTIHLEKVYIYQPVLYNKYRYIYIHMQNCGNKMNADEMEIKRIAFFSSVGNAASRSVVIPTYGPQLASTSFQSTEKGSPKFRQSIKVSTARVVR